jgi:hypothetical protein
MTPYAPPSTTLVRSARSGLATNNNPRIARTVKPLATSCRPGRTTPRMICWTSCRTLFANADVLRARKKA